MGLGVWVRVRVEARPRHAAHGDAARHAAHPIPHLVGVRVRVKGEG